MNETSDTTGNGLCPNCGQDRMQVVPLEAGIDESDGAKLTKEGGSACMKCAIPTAPTWC